MIRNPGDIVPTPSGYNRSDLIMAVEVVKGVKDAIGPCQTTVGGCSKCYLYKSSLCYNTNKDTIFGPCKSNDRTDGLNIVWRHHDYRDRYMGEEFIPCKGRTKLKVVRSLYDSYIDRCIGCFYYRSSVCYRNNVATGRCDSYARDDRVNIIFKRIDNDNKCYTGTFNLPRYIDNVIKPALCKICPYNDECNKTEQEMNTNSLCMFKLIRREL